jgi:hypothetical protein
MHFSQIFLTEGRTFMFFYLCLRGELFFGAVLGDVELHEVVLA